MQMLNTVAIYITRYTLLFHKFVVLIADKLAKRLRNGSETM